MMSSTGSTSSMASTSSFSFRIAVLADIHGNLPALEAVLADLAQQAVDEVLVGGDLVGRGPEGRAVVHRIAGLGWRGVRGNHEDYLLAFSEQRVAPEWLTAPEWAASRFMAAELDDFALGYAAGLPLSITSELAPHLRLVHGTPRSNNEGLGPWSSDGELAASLDAVAEPLLVCAHTHRSFERAVSTGRVVNVGSVGLPFNRDPRAQYGVFTVLPDGRTEVELRRVPYDRRETLERYRATGFAAAGGLTVVLLELELEHAVPVLVPFQRWAEASRRPAHADQLAAFLDFYRPGESLRGFFARLETLPETGD
jgi:predicted phosphodiesterase